MNQSQVTGVIDGGQEFQRWMQGRKAVAQRNGHVVAVGVVRRGSQRAVESGELRGIKARAAGGVVAVGSVLGNGERRPAGRVLRVEDGDDGIESVVGPAQPDEE